MTRARKKPSPPPGQGEGIKFLRSHVNHQGDECLVWPFYINPKGYGIVAYEGRPNRAHRLMCTLAHGEPPTPKHEAAHACHNRACVNPKHLSWKTSTGNHLDQRDNGTHRTSAYGRKGALTQEQAAAIRAAEGTKTQAALALEYGVSADTIRRIHRGQSYSGKPTDWQAARRKGEATMRARHEQARAEAWAEYLQELRQCR